MAAKFEINLEEALRQIAEFQLKMTGLGKHIDTLNKQSQRGGTSATQLMSELNKTYESLQKQILGLNGETRRSKEAIDSAFSKIRATAARTFEQIGKANLDATVKAQAYSGALKDVEKTLSDTAKKNTYVQAMQKIATIQEKSLADAKVLTYQIQQLATAQGQVTAELRTRLASETRMATAGTKQVQTNKELEQQLKLLNTTLGQANSVLQARIQNLSRSQQEETKAEGRLASLRRSYESLTSGIQQQIAQQQAMNQGLVQAATFRERELSQMAELRRRQESLNGGMAEQIANIKVQNQAREQQITETARYMVQMDQLRAKQASLNGGQAEEVTRMRAQIQAREQQIRNEERYVQTVTQLTQAEAQRRAQDEAGLRTSQALNSVIMERARATNSLSAADAKAIAQAEKLRADTKAKADALLEEARAAHGMSKAQQELNAVRQREEATLARLRQQRDQMNSQYGRESAVIQQQIREQKALNQLRAMSISQLLGLTSAQDRHNQSLNAGAQLTASMRAAITGLGQSFGMYTSGTIIAASSTYALFRAMKDTVSLGAEFTASMAQANAVMNSNQASWMPDSMKAMETQVRALGQTTVFTASEVAKGLVDLGQAGLSSAEAILSLRPALDLAQIGNISMSESADIATNVMMIFGKSAKDLTNVVDIMATAAVESNTNITQLANALSYAGPAAEAAGVSLEETTAAIEVLSKSGIKASRAGTALRKLFTSLLNPTEKGAAVMAKYNIATQNMDGSTRRLVDIVRDLNGALNETGVTEAQRLAAIQDLVGLYATSPVAALVKNAKSLENALYTLEHNVAGAAERMRTRMSDTLKVDWKTTLSAYEELQLQVYDKFESYLRYTSARITKTLLELTEPVKVLLDADLSTQSVDQLVEKANANGNKFTVGVDSSGNRVAKSDTGQVVNSEQLVAAMNQAAQAQVTVITNLDLMIQKFERFGEVALIVIAGILAKKVLGGLTTGIAGISQTAGELSARMLNTGTSAQATAGRFTLMAASTGSASAGMRMLYGTTASVAAGFGTLATASGLLANGIRVLSAAMLTVMPWVTIATVVGTIGYAIYAAFSGDNEQAIVDHKKEVEDLNAKYKDLNTQLDQLGKSKEKQSMLEQVKTLNLENDAIKARLKSLNDTVLTYKSLNQEAPKPVLIEISINEQRLQKTQGEIEEYNRRIQETGASYTEVASASDQAISAAADVAAQQKLVDLAYRDASSAMDESAGNKWSLYNTELALLNQLTAKMNEQVEVINNIGNSAIAVQAQINASIAAARSEADKAFIKEQSPGQRFDSYTQEMITLNRELNELAAKAERTGVIDPQTQLKTERMAKVMVEHAKANAQINEELDKSQKAQLAAQLAGLSAADKRAVYEKQINDLTRERTTLEAQKASGEIGTGVYTERSIEITEMLTTAKNGLATANNSVASSSNKAENAQASWSNKYGDFIGKQNAATKAAQEEAKAYASGSQAVAEYQIQKELTNEVLQLETEKIKLNVEQRRALEQAIRDRVTAEQERDIEKDLDNVRRETADIIAQTAAVVGGEQALRAYNITKEIEQQMLGKDPALRAKVIDQVKREAEARQNAADQLEKINRGDNLLKEYNKGRTLAREYAKDIAALEERFKAGGYSAAEYQKALRGVTNEYEDNRAALTIWGKLTQDALNRIDESFVDMWKNIGNGFDDFKTSLLDSFKQMLAEMAHAAITKPIMISFMNTILGTNKSGGIGDVWSSLFGAASSAGGGSSGGITSGGIGSILNMASSAYSAATGVLPAVSAGYTAGGVTGAIQGGIGYYSSMFSSAATTLSGYFSALTGAVTGNTAAIGATQGAYTGAAFANWVAANGGTAAMVPGSSAAAAGAGAASMAYLGPLAIAIGMWQSGKLYDAGVRYDTSEMQTSDLSKAGRALPGPVGFDRALTFASIGLADRTASKIFGGKMGAILSGSTLAFAVEKFIGEKLFGGSWQTKDAGLALSVNSGQFTPEDFQYQKKKGGLFSSNKKRYVYGEMADPEMANELGSIYNTTILGVMDLFGALNVSLNDTVLDNLNVARMNISTLDKTQEDIQKEINDWFVTVGDSAVTAIRDATNSDLTGFTFESLTTFVNNLISVNSAIGAMGVKTLEMSIASGHMVQNLVDLAGSLETLNSNMSSYYDNFTTEVQKSTDVIAGARAQFAMLGVALPQTRQAYIDLTRAQDLTTQAGRDMFTILTSGAASASQAYAVLEQRQSDYYAAFHTETENTARSIAETTAAVKILGVTLPATRAEFRAMVEAAQKDTSAAGKALYETLLSVAGQAGSVFDSLEAAAEAASTVAEEAAKALADSLGNAVSAALSAVQRAVTAEQQKLTDAYNARNTALNDMLETQKSAVSDLTSIGSSLTSALKELNGESDTTVRLMREQAKATLERALAYSRTGKSLAGFTGLDDALSTASSIEPNRYASREDMERDRGQTAAIIAQLEAVNGKQLTIAERSVKSLEEQIATAKATYELQKDRLDKQLEKAQAQVDALNGVDNSVISVGAAVQALSAAVVAALAVQDKGAASANNYENNAKILEAVYQVALGRGVDPSGMASWTAELASGRVTYATLLDTIANAAKANGEKVKIPGYASGGMFGGGWRVVGEQGPELEATGRSRIHSASATQGIFAGAFDELVEEVIELRETMKSHLFAIAKSTSKTANNTDLLPRKLEEELLG